MFINDNTFDNTLINISPASWSVNHKATSPFDTRVAEWDVTLDFNESSGKIDQVVFGQSGTTYDSRTMNYNTHYYWPNRFMGQPRSINCRTNMGLHNGTSSWNSPYVPSSSSPSDGATNVPIDADLSWTGGGPDGDPVTYDVYFGTNSSPPQIATGISEETYDPGTLEYGTTYDPGTLDYETVYYWRIVAWDNHSAATQGPIWSFTTEDRPTPDLDCYGELNWEDIEPGATVTGTFTVENIGEPLSLLDWEIESYPEWGNWTFDPESGTGLLPGTPVTVDVEVIAPDEPETEFTGEIILVNSNDPDDICIIDVTLATPVNQNSMNSQASHILQNLIRCSPIFSEIF